MLIYNPKVDSANKPDVQVEYNFYQKLAGQPEKFFNKTNPQNLNAQTLPPKFDFAAGHQLQSGQAVPLASFPEGDYRLEIKVTDKIANKTLTRETQLYGQPFVRRGQLQGVMMQQHVQNDGVGGRRRSGAALSAGHHAGAVCRATASGDASRVARRGLDPGSVQDEKARRSPAPWSRRSARQPRSPSTDRSGGSSCARSRPGPYLLRAHLTRLRRVARAGYRRPPERAVRLPRLRSGARNVAVERRPPRRYSLPGVGAAPIVGQPIESPDAGVRRRRAPATTTITARWRGGCVTRAAAS